MIEINLKSIPIDFINAYSPESGRFETITPTFNFEKGDRYATCLLLDNIFFNPRIGIKVIPPNQTAVVFRYERALAQITVIYWLVLRSQSSNRKITRSRPENYAINILNCQDYLSNLDDETSISYFSEVCIYAPNNYSFCPTHKVFQDLDDKFSFFASPEISLELNYKYMLDPETKMKSSAIYYMGDRTLGQCEGYLDALATLRLLIEKKYNPFASFIDSNEFLRNQALGIVDLPSYISEIPV
jgi:hypothetical protein